MYIYITTHTGKCKHIYRDKHNIYIYTCIYNFKTKYQRSS